MRPLRHPLAAQDLAGFCHPRNAPFRAPVRHGSHIIAANGYLAIRLSRGPALHDDTVPAASPDFSARIDRLPWARLDSPGPSLVAAEWRPLDDVRGLLYQFGTEELWPGGHMTRDKAVWVAESMLVPLALLQLIASLPAAAICTPAERDFLLLRFSGGDGLIAARWRHAAPQQIPPPAFRILSPRNRPLIPGGLL